MTTSSGANGRRTCRPLPNCYRTIIRSRFRPPIAIQPPGVGAADVDRTVASTVQGTIVARRGVLCEAARKGGFVGGWRLDDAPRGRMPNSSAVRGRVHRGRSTIKLATFSEENPNQGQHPKVRAEASARAKATVAIFEREAAPV